MNFEFEKIEGELRQGKEKEKKIPTIGSFE
jgi:hypothetical protein